MSMEQLLVNSNNAIAPADTKPFCLRRYVLISRQKDLSQSWPFPEKYLKMCLRHGIVDVLPPFESPDFCMDQPNRGDNEINASTEDFTMKKDANEMEKGGFGASFEETSSILPQQYALCLEPSEIQGTNKSGHRKRGRRGKAKKRLLAEIFAVAKQCTLEELNGRQKITRESMQMGNAEGDSKSVLTDDSSI
ncbi:hypothetical protein Nepgr_020479 [Nepenthes gracilis]|uniref:Uncharacterized protein n=1 Tax=Nepenthes gracilis TaxID=150966 RepID=A0AAD3SW59_NEPGR|nr:hypothetical protein Nepgr_020479 [Nepenthes gracilis]